MKKKKKMCIIRDLKNRTKYVRRITFVGTTGRNVEIRCSTDNPVNYGGRMKTLVMRV